MPQASAIEWWQNSLTEVGVQGMERLLSRDANWDDVLESGRLDLQIALDVTGMRTGPEYTAVEIGCGIGRMTQALGEHFGRVVGLDIAPALLELAAQRNTNPAVTFQLVDGSRLPPLNGQSVDTVFSYEVLYYLAPPTFQQYVNDIFQLLKPGGEFVFHHNLDPLRWITRASYAVRSGLWALGVKEWRGWPTGPGFRRYAYSPAGVIQTLTDAGFEIAKVHSLVLSRSWFVARKPSLPEEIPGAAHSPVCAGTR